MSFRNRRTAEPTPPAEQPPARRAEGVGSPGPAGAAPGREGPGVPAGPCAIAPGRARVAAGLQTLCLHTPVLGRRERGARQANLCREIRIKMQQKNSAKKNKIKIIAKWTPTASLGGASPTQSHSLCVAKINREKNCWFCLTGDKRFSTFL